MSVEHRPDKGDYNVDNFPDHHPGDISQERPTGGKLIPDPVNLGTEGGLPPQE